MAENNVNRLPVVKAGQVVGIVTRQDVILVVAGKTR
jgi:CBS domain-containing protein